MPELLDRAPRRVPVTGPAYQDGPVTVWHGDSLHLLADRELFPDNSFDAIVTDPPYSLSFMSKHWDGWESPGAFEAWCTQWAAECLRVLKPGGYLLAFGGSRTHHRATSGIEDAGFEIRDCITWHFGNGFPKSLNVTDALARIAPAGVRCVCGPRSTQTVLGSQDDYLSSRGFDDAQPRTVADSGQAPAPLRDGVHGRSRAGRRVDGQAAGQASNAPDEASGHPSNGDLPVLSVPPQGGVQPSAAAPSDTRTSTSAVPDSGPRRTLDHTQRTSGLADGSASASSWRNKHMACSICGGLDIPPGLGTALKPATEFVIVARKPLAGTVAANVLQHGTGALNIAGCRVEHASAADLAVSQAKNPCREEAVTSGVYGAGRPQQSVSTAGRWPPNVLLDEQAAAEMDRQSGGSVSRVGKPRSAAAGDGWGMTATGAEYADAGGASRYFPTFRYEPKAGADERPKYWRHACDCAHDQPMRPAGNCEACGRPGELVAHPTVKPVDLIAWLVRLVTRPGGRVLDLFAGTATTGEACLLEGMECVLIEREADYLPLIRQRLSKPVQQGLFGLDPH